MSPVISVIAYTSCEKIMQCGCAAALKGMAAWKGGIFGLNRKAARNKTRTRSKSCKFHFRRQPNYNRVFRWIYWIFEENLPKWRSVAVARSSSLWERCACWVYAQPWLRSLLLTSRSKSRRLWMQRSIKKLNNKKITHYSRNAVMMWGSSDGRASVCFYEQFLSAAAGPSARTRGVLVVRLLDNLLAFPKQTRG